MSETSEVFRFTVVRPPEAIEPSSPVRLPGVQELGGAGRARKLAAEAEAMVKSGPGLAEADLNEGDVRDMLAATLLFGSSAKVANTLAERLLPANGPLVVENLAELGISLFDGGGPAREQAHFGPVGVGDVMVVEQHLTGYEAGEIAHIENVMKSEIRERVHRLETERETIFETEEEITRFMEQDLQSTERFELQTSAQQEIEQRSKLEAGLEVSGSYGPTIEVKASLDYSLENAKKQSNSRASEYSKEIVEHSVNRTQERLKERRQERRRTTTEDKNLHRFENNVPESEHIVGIYRFIEKIYQMKLVNRGKRFFYEFILPDPGSFLRNVRGQPQASSLRPPRKPRETVTAITPENYAGKLRTYGVVNVPPPPGEEVTKVVTFSDRDTGDSGAQRFMQEGEIQIPPGYKADKANVTIVAWEQHKTDPRIHMSIGDQQKGWRGGDMRRDNDIRRDEPGALVVFDNLGGQTGSIGFSFFIQHDSTVQVKIELRCVPTEQALLEWKHTVYNAIFDDYQKRLTEHNAAKAEEEGTFRPQLLEAPPQRLREIERDELKRLCLQLVGQRARVVDPLSEGDIPLVLEDGEAPLEEGAGDELIQVGRLEPLAKEIRFGEQAFEWSNMTFVLYPYFWSDPEQWDDLVTLEHVDPQHGQFLRAGAARVLVPVRPHFQRTVHDFLSRGSRALDFAEEVTITDHRWLPLYTEIEEAQNPSARNEEVVRCWTVRLPTNLIMLSLTSELPSFPVPEDCPDPPTDG